MMGTGGRTRGMRVLMTADAVGGVWQYALELIGALAAHDVHVDLAVMGPPPDDAQRDQARAHDNVSLYESDYRLEWMDDSEADLRAAGGWLLELERALRPDVVHLNGYAHAALRWTAPVIVVAHSCVLSWWQTTLNEPAPPRYDAYRTAVARGLAAAHTVVAPTAAMMRMLAEHYLPPHRTRVIPNGRTPAAAPVSAERSGVLAVGRVWDPAKNLAALARVAPRLTQDVRIAGRDTDPHGRRIALEGVEMLGQLAARELAAEYTRAAVFVAPARYEPFGLAALEAAGAGCALVLSDIPTYREVWGDAAVYVPADDDDAFAAAIQRLLGDASLRSTQAERARLRAQEYTPERMARAYHALYRATLPDAAPATLVIS